MITAGRKVVTTAGTAVNFSGSSCKEVIITAETDNTGVVVVGGSGVIASLATRLGVPLNAGDSVVIGLSDDLSELWLDSTVSGDGVTFLQSDKSGVFQVNNNGPLDASGNTKVSLATLIAGEDLTNDVQKVEQRFSYAYLAGVDTAVKSGAGFVHTLTFTCIDAAPTAGTIIVYDNTAESGTIIYSETFTTTPFRAYSVLIDSSFSTGLYVGFTTTADVGVTVSYR